MTSSRRRFLQQAALGCGLPAAGIASPAAATHVLRTRGAASPAPANRACTCSGHPVRRGHSPAACLRNRNPRRGVRDASGASAIRNAAVKAPAAKTACSSTWTPALRDGGSARSSSISTARYNTAPQSASRRHAALPARRRGGATLTTGPTPSATCISPVRGAEYAASGNVGQLDLVRPCTDRRTRGGIGGDAGNVTPVRAIRWRRQDRHADGDAGSRLFHRAWTMSGQQVTAAGPRAVDQRARLYLMHGVAHGDIDAANCPRAAAGAIHPRSFPRGGHRAVLRPGDGWRVLAAAPVLAGCATAVRASRWWSATRATRHALSATIPTTSRSPTHCLRSWVRNNTSTSTRPSSSRNTAGLPTTRRATSSPPPPRGVPARRHGTRSLRTRRPRHRAYQLDWHPSGAK